MTRVPIICTYHIGSSLPLAGLLTCRCNKCRNYSISFLKFPVTNGLLFALPFLPTFPVFLSFSLFTFSCSFSFFCYRCFRRSSFCSSFFFLSSAAFNLLVCASSDVNMKNLSCAFPASLAFFSTFNVGYC